MRVTQGNADAAAAPKPASQSPKKHAGQHFLRAFHKHHSLAASRPCLQLIFETHLIKYPISNNKIAITKAILKFF